MIRSFRHKGFKRLHLADDASGVLSAHVAKIRRVLLLLDSTTQPGDMDLPGFKLYPLKGDLKGFWAVSVSGNWRIIFRFVDGDAVDVELIDYHGR